MSVLEKYLSEATNTKDLQTKFKAVRKKLYDAYFDINQIKTNNIDVPAQQKQVDALYKNFKKFLDQYDGVVARLN